MCHKDKITTTIDWLGYSINSTVSLLLTKKMYKKFIKRFCNKLTRKRDKNKAYLLTALLSTLSFQADIAYEEGNEEKSNFLYDEYNCVLTFFKKLITGRL